MTRATITTEIGDIEVELFDESAPKAASNFIDLAKKGFYDDVIFHRVIPGFVIQGGDGQYGKKSALERSRVGTGGPGYKFEDEPVKGDYQRGSLAEATHQIRVPLGPVRRRDEHVVATTNEIELEARPYAVEHLKFEAAAVDVVLLGEADRVLDQRLVVRRDRGVRRAREHALEQPRVARVDVCLPRVRDRLRLEVGAFDEPQVRLERQEALEVGGSPVEVGLQNRSDVVEALFA
jgi:hypothetical protein